MWFVKYGIYHHQWKARAEKEINAVTNIYSSLNAIFIRVFKNTELRDNGSFHYLHPAQLAQW